MKKKREDTNPTVFFDQTSNSRLVDSSEIIQIAPILSPTAMIYRNIDREQTALKLNWLKEKVPKYESHKDILSWCVAHKLAPKPLKLEL